MSKYLLLTGATGLVGRYLLRDLLLAGQRVAVVLRPTAKETVQLRIEGILQHWEKEFGRPLPRPVCLEGDVAEPLAGLSLESRAWIAAHCDRIVHNAAILTFYGADRTGEPWRTNVEGTRQILALCREARLGELHYVSTAYVCGRRQDHVLESELNVGQNFRNDYEHSKLLAETLVREATFIPNITIYRPAVIAGDSQTGYTTTYHGLYMYLKLMSVLVWNTEPGPDGRRHTPIRLNMTGDEPRNIIPVDWVSTVLCRLINDPAAHGQTYHLAPKRRLTPREIIDAGYKYFNSYGVEFVGQSPSTVAELSQFEQSAYENKTMYEPYEHTDPEFDTSNLDRMAPDLPCPEIDEGMLHRFWKYGEEDRWGKRRVPIARVPADVGALLTSRVEGLAASANGHERLHAEYRVALNVFGPGGGQWTLSFGPGGMQLLAGIGESPHALWETTAAQFVALLDANPQEVNAHLTAHVNTIGPTNGFHPVAALVAFLSPSASARPELVADASGA